MDKKESCIFLLDVLPGGAEQLLYKLGLYLKIKKVFVFKTKHNNIWEEAGFEVIYFNSSISKMHLCLKDNKFDTVLSSHLLMNAMLGFYRAIGLLKTQSLICRESTSVFLRHTGLKLLKYKCAYLIGYRKIDLLITQSDHMKSILLEKLPYLQKRIKIKTIPNLFIFPETYFDKSPYEFSYIVSAGRLISEKGFDILISAFYKIHMSNPDLKLVIIGEGYCRLDLEKQVNELGLAEDVLLPGFTKDVYRYFKYAEMCIVSSRIEGFPNVLLEMMSQNDKVVSTLCAGGIDNIRGVVTCETNNVDSLYNAMIKAMNKPTRGNREMFDSELKSRSINSFASSIQEYLIK